MATAIRSREFSLLKAITESIDREFAKEAEKIFAAKEKELVADLEEMKSRVIGKIAMQVSKQFDIQSNGEKITITFIERH